MFFERFLHKLYFRHRSLCMNINNNKLIFCGIHIIFSMNSNDIPYFTPKPILSKRDAAKTYKNDRALCHVGRDNTLDFRKRLDRFSRSYRK